MQSHRHDCIEKVIHWELCKKYKFDHTNKWYMHNPESVLKNETLKILWDFEIQIDHLVSASDSQQKKEKKKRTCQIVDLAIPTDHRVKLRENKKRDKYLYLAWELQKLWNMKVMVIPVIIGTLDTVTKGLVPVLKNLEIRGRVETIQSTALFGLVRILRRVLETWGNLLSLRLQRKTISYCWCEKLSMIKIIIIIRLKDWKIQEHPDYSIVQIGQDTEKSPGDLRRFAFSNKHNE